MTDEKIISFEPLYESMLKCRKGVLWKGSAAYYYLHGIEQTLKLSEQLKNRTYKPDRIRRFKVTYPKERDIISISFRDRVYQRSLNDNVLYPNMVKSFIYPNMACQVGKGTDKARMYLDRIMKRAFWKYDYACYVLQCDIEGYYLNMRHAVVYDLFKRKLSNDAFSRAVKVLNSQYSSDTGYNPGSQMVQIAGISVLDEMDHYIKEQLHVKYYLRYMDDFILIHQDVDYLESCKQRINDFLTDIGFSLNAKKTRIFPLNKGIKMLGFIHKITPTGKVIRILDPNNVKHERKKLRKMVHLCKKGLITREKVDSCFNAWKAHAMKGNSHQLITRMNRYYKELWINDY